MSVRASPGFHIFASAAAFWCVVFLIIVGLVLVAGCAGSTSEITPAKSDASEKSIDYSGESRKSSHIWVEIGDAAEEAGEDK